MYERELEVAVNAAKQAGEVVRGYFKDEYTVKDKGEDNPLTDADLGSNDVLERHLRGSFPDYGWLSEETVDSPERLDKRMAWIIDPLDGTKEFTLGIPEFVVSIGLVVEGRAVLGVLYNPIKEELFSGVVGQGATLNGDAIRVSVHDSGPGISPEHLPLIFDRFYKADSARASAGSGLGLSIVKGIVDAHGGTITARNDAGALFEITLPRQSMRKSA